MVTTNAFKLDPSKVLCFESCFILHIRVVEGRGRI